MTDVERDCEYCGYQLVTGKNTCSACGKTQGWMFKLEHWAKILSFPLIAFGVVEIYVATSKLLEKRVEVWASTSKVDKYHALLVGNVGNVPVVVQSNEFVADDASLVKTTPYRVGDYNIDPSRSQNFVLNPFPELADFTYYNTNFFPEDKCPEMLSWLESVKNTFETARPISSCQIRTNISSIDRYARSVDWDIDCAEMLAVFDDAYMATKKMCLRSAEAN